MNEQANGQVNVLGVGTTICLCLCKGYASTSVTVGVCILQASIYPVDVVTAVKG